MPVDEKSPYLHMPLPHEANTLDQDLTRLRAAFNNLDSHAQSSDAARAALESELESKSRELAARDDALRKTLESATADLVAHLAAENPHHLPLASRDAPGLAQVGQGLELDQGVISVRPATDSTPGLVRPDNVSVTITEDGTISAASNYEICEFYFFRHPTLRPGFQPAQGGLLENAATLYPEAWAYLQTVEGQKLCATEAEWQAMTRATWATLADGTAVGWNGIGGAPFYAPNTATGALRLPDLRGMYAEAAGFDALGVGGVHGDAVRNITGAFYKPDYPNHWGSTGFFSPGSGTFYFFQGASSGVNAFRSSSAAASNVVPTASQNQPRAWGALACVFLGKSAS